MSKVILQVNHTFDIPPAEYEDAVSSFGEPIAAVEGLLWKVWLDMNESGESGGIYLFESREAVQAYLDGPIVQWLAQNPALRDIQVKLFPVLESPSLVTRGPLSLRPAAAAAITVDR